MFRARWLFFPTVENGQVLGTQTASRPERSTKLRAASFSTFAAWYKITAVPILSVLLIYYLGVLMYQRKDYVPSRNAHKNIFQGGSFGSGRIPPLSPSFHIALPKGCRRVGGGDDKDP